MESKDKRHIVDHVMKDLKTQADRKREIVVRKSIVINPRLLINTNPSVYGPYMFNTTFPRNPFITFGQARLNQTRVAGILIVQPYVDRWISSSGGIKGFYLGVYALTSIPHGLNSHTIIWRAEGKASLYKADAKYDKWNAPYNFNESTHLKSSDLPVAD